MLNWIVEMELFLYAKLNSLKWDCFEIQLCVDINYTYTKLKYLN